MEKKLLYIFTRTPLHVGAGSSVGAIDQPIQRERHTGFPIIPASALKGCFADEWPTTQKDQQGKSSRISTGKMLENGGQQNALLAADDAAWLFGSDTTDLAFAGALLFSEARVLAFPVRSAKGSFAWITCPLMLQRAASDGVISCKIPAEPEQDDLAIFHPNGPLALDGGKIVLEDYCFEATSEYPEELAEALAALIDDALFASVAKRLVILTNGMMSYFASTACEIAQHVRISDETGTAESTGLFNQENVPAETLFYSVLRSSKSHVPDGKFQGKSPSESLQVFGDKVRETKVFQFGGDASTGLGFCSVSVCEKS